MAKDNKISFTLRLTNETSDRIEKEAKRLGLTKTSYVSMVIHKSLEESESSN